ncbi:MAG: tRNA modification GTPase [Planctomycetaceae bacterium]|nr:tRNA modification GTPase [Planctomycetaceae bacterium]
MFVDDTIAALATARGPAERGMIRISGPCAKQVVDGCFTASDQPRWRDAKISQRHRGTVVVTGLHLPLTVDVWFWPSRRSYTGQPVAEVHVVGATPVLEALQQEFFAHGARPAQRGEFSLRAFLAGRIDLMQAEAVLGVIEATDQQQLRLALDQLAGGLSHRIAELHEELLLHLADLEAGLDFVEEDIEFVSREQLHDRIADGLRFLEGLLQQARARMQSTGRRRVVLAGLPNAGKSTLFNFLAGQEAALVSSIPGTTRDYLSVPLDWNGVAIDLVDTAGWEEIEERQGERQVNQSADLFRGDQWRRADLILWCSASDQGAGAGVIEERLRAQVAGDAKPLVSLRTKSDLNRQLDDAADLQVSAATGAGIEALKTAVVVRLQGAAGGDEILGSTAARCQESLRGGIDALNRARAAAESAQGDELVAVELRTALDRLGEIVGRVYTDDILDRIFSRFCIGK